MLDKMQSYTWNPDLVLRITKLDEDGMFCVGYATSKYNGRCRWSIERPQYSEIRSILSAMAQRPPDDKSITRDLESIAKQGVCGYHNRQISGIVDEWRWIISQGPVKDYKRYLDLRKKNQFLNAELDDAYREHRACVELLLGTKTGEADTDDVRLYDLVRSRLDHQQMESDTARKLSMTKRLLKDVNTENTKLRESVTNLRARLTSVKDQRRKETEGTRLARAMLTRRLMIKEKRLGDVRQKLKQSQFACEELSSQREEVRHELVMAQENLADIQLQVQVQTRERQRVVAEAIRETQGLLDVVQSEKVELAAQFKKVSREMQELKTRNFGLLSANTKLDVEAKEAEKAIQAGLEENKCLSAEVAITSNALQVSQMELRDSRQANTTLEGRLEAAVAEVAELQAQLTKVEARESRSLYKRLRHWMSKAKDIISNWFSRGYRSDGNNVESISLRRQSFQLLH